MATVKVQGWGAGGSGGARTGGTGSATGGGGGAYSQLNALAVVSGTGYAVTIGAKGTGVSGNTQGILGGDTNFVDALTLLAKGGGAGISNSGSSATASGGASGSGVGDVKKSGGNSSTSGSGFKGGGGSGGDTTDGGSTSTTTGGIAGTTNGAKGGDNNVSGAGDPGSFPGGAGGAALNGNTSGDGAGGQVVIIAALGVITSATGGVHTSDSNFDYWTFTASGTWTPLIPFLHSTNETVTSTEVNAVVMAAIHTVLEGVLNTEIVVSLRSIWRNATKNLITFVNTAKHTISPTNVSKNVVTWINQSKS